LAGQARTILQGGTPGSSGSIMDLYTTLPRCTLCEDVAKLKADLLEGQVIELQPAESPVVEDGHQDFGASPDAGWTGLDRRARGAVASVPCAGAERRHRRARPRRPPRARTNEKRT